MAPEMLEEDYTLQCDMWSMGVLAYILLVGKMPFNTADGIMNANYRLSGRDKKHLSEESLDFVGKLLVVDPRTRMTAPQAMEHPWLRTRASASTVASAEVAGSLVNFRKLSRLRRMCALLMAVSLTEAEKTQLHEDFLGLDEDGNGVISLQEFKQAVGDRFEAEQESKSSGDYASSSEDVDALRAAFDSMDFDSSDSLSYTEFLAAVMYARLVPTEGHLMKAFQRFDRDAKGAIGKEDVAKYMGLQVGDNTEEVASIMQEMDASPSGMVSYHQWAAFLRRGNSVAATDSQISRLQDGSYDPGVIRWSFPASPKPQYETLESFLDGAPVA